MRSKYLLQILDVFIVSLLIGCTYNVSNDDFLLYEDTEYKVKINYPKDWEIVDTETDVFAFRSQQMPGENVHASLNLQMLDAF